MSRSVVEDRPTARLEQSTAGRVRVRLARRDRGPENFRRVRDRVQLVEGVREVEVNPRTGSVLVRCDDSEPVRIALGEVCELLAAATQEGDRSAVDEVVAAVKLVDRRLEALTNRRLSLRWVVPGAFIAFGIRQLLRTGLTVGAVPWYVLLYYGIDTFLKLNPEHGPLTRVVGPARYR